MKFITSIKPNTQRSCRNKCIFCFVDQLPKGMRESLYYKDDDVRLSFLHGNYVTLTNMSQGDIARLIRLRLSPVNVSVHTLNPKLREFIIGRKDTKSYLYLRFLAKAGIKLNCQIVCCPGINDGRELSETIKGLMKLGRSIQSVSIVPVGLTKHRQGLVKLRPFNKELARKTIRLVEHYGALCRKKRGSTVFFCADELYMTAGLKLPPDKFYEDYPQLENGVGMMRLFIKEFKEAAKTDVTTIGIEQKDVTLITGALAAPYLTKLLQVYIKKYVKIRIIKNNFFGESVTVSGLITGKDIITQLKDIKPGSKLLIPINMLRCNDDIFLDDITVSDVSEALKVDVIVIKQNGAELYKTLRNLTSMEANDA